MPDLVSAYRTYKNEAGQVVTEHHRLLAVNAKEAVKNGRGEWKLTPPKDGATVVTVPSKQEMTDSETRPERRGRKGKAAEGGLAKAEEDAGVATGEGVE